MHFRDKGIKRWPLKLLNYVDYFVQAYLWLETAVQVIVCLFWDFSSHSRIFHSFGDIPITSEGLQILTYAWHPLI